MNQKKMERLNKVYELFPILKDREHQTETLSGGGTANAHIARGLMSNPKLLMVDEISLGLAPVLVDRVMEALKLISDNVTILMVEQKVQEALEIADRGLCLTKWSTCNGKVQVRNY